MRCPTYGSRAGAPRAQNRRQAPIKWASELRLRFSYAWFCERYKEWTGRLKPTLRQVHVAGEKLFVDYSGHTMEVVDGLSGEIRSAQIFVAVLGASNYTYAEASLSQGLPDWIASHVRAFAYFGGVARIVHATKPRSKSGSTSSDDGSWHACATAASFRSPPSTRRSTRSWSS